MKLKFDSRMTPRQHVELCNHLQGAMSSPGDCDHRLTRSELFLKACGHDDVAGAAQWLKEHGGYCDCEVIMNTIPWDEIADQAT